MKDYCTLDARPIKARILPELDTPDWEEVFIFTLQAFGDAPFLDVYMRFDRAQIKRIVRIEEGYQTEKPWRGVFELHCGLFVSVHCRMTCANWG